MKLQRLFRYLLILTLAGATPYAGADQTDQYATVRDTLQTCVACHGEAGAAPIDPEYPILAGQHLYYTYLQLRDFKSGSRQNAIMNGIAAPLEKDRMKLIAQFFSEQKWPSSSYRASSEAIKLGHQASTAGQCVQCHLGGYEGASGVPRLAGQNYEYLRKTLLEYKNRIRLNAPDKASLMEAYTEEQLDALAQFLASR